MKSRGFTLLELLMVVALLAVLAALLLPVLAQAQRRARRTTCLTNLRELARAHLLYLQDWEEQFPSWQMPGSREADRYWTTFLQPYLRSSAVLWDPETPVHTPAQEGPPFLADYALLTWEKAGRPGAPSEPAQRWPGPPMSLGQVARPAETIQWTEGRTARTWTASAFWRHGGGLNAAFVDGHARWMTYREFWRVTPDAGGIYWLYWGSALR
jgi:prepilin-type N-terminal cleavage/methylation domain-containing protein/prepilin-type processing-associated H-X9-DG protein